MEIIFALLVLAICCIFVYRTIRDSLNAKAIKECVARYEKVGNTVKLKKRDARLKRVLRAESERYVTRNAGNGYLILFVFLGYFLRAAIDRLMI